MTEPEIVYCDEEFSEEDDAFEWANMVYSIIESNGVRVARYETARYAALVDGEVVGGVVAGAPTGNPFDGVRFSIAVLSEYRRRGIARALTQALIEECGELECPVEAWVINDNMIPMLEGLGFEKTYGPIWRLET